MAMLANAHRATSMRISAGRPTPRPFACSPRSSSLASASAASRASLGRAIVCQASSGGGGPLEGLINSITVALKNSPINEGKKALAIAQAGQYDEAAVRAKVEQYINSSPVVVFSWTGCPFCKNAKALLTEVGAKFTAVELDTMGAEGKAMRAELAKLTDRTSVPNVFIAGRSVGGCNDGPGVATLEARGELRPLLQAAGAL